MLRDSRGQFITDPDAIPARWLEYFTELYAGRNIPREELSSTPTEAALTGHRMLEHALRDHPDATFAIRCKIDADVLDRP